MNLPEVVAEVRGVPVRFQSGPWGVTSHATRRGYFPLSETGFRSGFAAHAFPPSAAALEHVAAACDKERADALRNARRALATEPALVPSASAFIRQLGAATRAADVGLFAPDEDRRALWAAALAICNRIGAERGFHPVPGPDVGACWDETYCAKSLDRVAALRAFLAAASTGELQPVAQHGRPFGFATYCELPARTEPTFEAEHITHTLDLFPGLDLADEDRDPEDDDPDAAGDEFPDPVAPATEPAAALSAEDPAQLALF